MNCGSQKEWALPIVPCG